MILTECNILLVDDEHNILKMNKKLLAESGFTNVATCANASDADAWISEEAVDLVVLDIMLPDGDGFLLYERWKHRGINVPVIFLSARDEETSRLRGLGLGADDYVTKPYTPEELLLRIKAVLRRTYHLTENRVVELGTVKVDLSSGIVYRPEGQLELTAKEFNLFAKLYDNQGKIVSINTLMDTLWPDGSYGLENSLVVHIRRLREKIEETPSNPKHLQTVRGLGYRLSVGGKPS
ncbi:MAG: response regulator transcription factor [Lachnospiraceae bacterium]|nr:response regulator transcription factor [Lachnospiraceae bacterium]